MKVFPQRRISCLITLLVFLVGSSTETNGQQDRLNPPDAIELFGDIPWFAIERGELDVAFEVVLRVTRSSALSAEVVHAAWARLEHLPDHPDRGRVEFLRRLLDAEEELSLRIVYTPEGGWYRSDEQVLGGQLIRTESGGRDDLSWRGTEIGGHSALTIVKRDVPFPARFNARAMHSRFNDEIGLLLSHGLRHIVLPTSQVSNWRPAGNTVAGRITTEFGGVWSLSAELGEDGRPEAVRLIELISPNTDGAAVMRRGAVFRPLGQRGMLIPFDMTKIDSGGIQERYEVTGLRVLDRAEARQVGMLPGFSEYDAVHDFRKLVATADSGSESSLIVWTSSEAGGQTITPNPSDASNTGRPRFRVVGAILLVLAFTLAVAKAAKIRN